MACQGPAHHGLSAREQEIMDLYDAGDSEAAIAAQLDLQRPYVRQVVQWFDFQTVWCQGNRFDAMVRRGSQALAAACARTGGRFA